MIGLRRPFHRRLWRHVVCLLSLVAAVPVWLICTAAPAAADDSSHSQGSAPAALSWMKIRDSHGVSIWKYQLSLDRGGVTAPGKVIWSFVVDLAWQIYVGVVAVAIWLIDWVLSFDWLTTVTKPAMGLSRSLSSIVDRFGLPPVLLTVAALVAVLWMARGRWVLGTFELFTSLIVASLSVGILANPVGLVAGPDGLMMHSRDFGLQVADGLAGQDTTAAATGGTNSADSLREQVSGMLTDTFIRQPHQLVNFGEVIDGGKCEKTYTKAIEKGPYDADSSDLRDAVGGCNADLGDVASNPGPGMAMSAIVLAPAALVVLLFAIVLAGAVLVAGVYALYQSLKAIVTLVTGLLPGSARGSLWMTLAELVMALVTVVFAIVFLAAYLLLIQGVFTSHAAGQSPMATFFAVDILLMVGIVVFWRGRSRLKKAADRLAQVLATRPGGGASSLPARRPWSATDAYYKGRMAVGGAQWASNGVRAGASRSAGALGRAGALAGSGAGRAGVLAGGLAGLLAGTAGGASVGGGGSSGGSPGDPGSAGTGVGGGPSPSSPSGGGQLRRVGARAGTLALAAATGGTSVVTTTALQSATRQGAGRMQKAVSESRRAAVTGKLRPAPSPRAIVGPSPVRDPRSNSSADLPAAQQTVTGRVLPTRSTTGAAATARSVLAPAVGSVARSNSRPAPRPATTATPSVTPTVTGHTISAPAAAPKNPATSATSSGTTQSESEARLRARLAARRAIALPTASRRPGDVPPRPSRSAR